MTTISSEMDGTDFRLLLEAATGSMLLATGDGTFVEANSEACNLLRRTRDYTNGTPTQPRADHDHQRAAKNKFTENLA